MTDFINAMDCLSSAILIHECVELIDFLYEKTATKCINLFIPKQDTHNNDIISEELKNTQDYIYCFITSCEYQLQKETIKQLKKYCREVKYETNKKLYEVLRGV